MDVAVHFLRVDPGAIRHHRFRADLDAVIFGGSVSPQASAIGTVPDKSGKAVQGEFARGWIARPEPELRRPAGSQLQAGYQRAEPRAGRDDYLRCPELDGRGARGDAVLAGLDAGDHRVRVDLGAQPLGGRRVRPDVALGVADSRARIPDGDVRFRQARVLRLPGEKFGVAELLDRQPGRGGGRDRTGHRAAVRRSNAQAAALLHQPLPGLPSKPGPQLQRLQRDGGQAWVFLAGDPEQPGQAVRGTKVVPDAVPLDASNVNSLVRQPPQGRGAKRAQAYHDDVLTDDLHRRRPYPLDIADSEPAGPVRVLSAPGAGSASGVANYGRATTEMRNDDERDRGQRAGQALRQDDGAGRGRPRGTSGYRAGRSRAERRRQDDGRPDPGHTAPARWRAGAGVRL